MKKLKLTNVLAMFIMLFGLMITQNSCKDPCKDVECKNSGTCDEGVCSCVEGYEGDDCGTEVRAKFLGTFSVSDACDPGSSYTSVISSSSTAVDRVLITNVLGVSLGGTAYANAAGTTLTLPSQQVTDIDGDTWTVSGSGSKSGDQVTLSIISTFGAGNPVTCALTLTPQ